MSKEGWATVVGAAFSLGLTVTPGIQSWWFAAPVWALTALAAWRWYSHREETPSEPFSGQFFKKPSPVGDGAEQPKEIRRRSGWVWMMAQQRSVSIELGFTNPHRIRYQWEPKSEVSADIVGATMQFVRLTPSRRTSVHIHWELIEYDRDVEQHQLHMLKP